MYIIKKNKGLEELIKENITIVDCYADWCGPCKLFRPIFEDAENVYKDIKFCKLNVDENKILSKSLGVMSIPTVILFNEGKEVKRYTGYMDEDTFNEFLNNK